MAFGGFLVVCFVLFLLAARTISFFFLFPSFFEQMTLCNHSECFSTQSLILSVDMKSINSTLGKK